MADRGRIWLITAGTVFVLLAQPCAGLEIGHAIVTSKQGEPLAAVVQIFLSPGEKLDGTCLSVADRQTFPQSEHALITNATLTLNDAGSSIGITTTKPVVHRVVTVALRVQCEQRPPRIQAINLYLEPSPAITASAADSSLPGTTITVRPGDSIYHLSRLIFPHDERAVRNLADAIIAANPKLFPEGRGRPLRIGERLTIPDLRTIEEISRKSQRRDTLSTGQAAKLTSVVEKPLAPKHQKASEDSARRPTETRRTPAQERGMAQRMILANGKLLLRLTTSLDLSRLQGTIAKQEVAPQPEAGATIASANDLLDLSALSMRVDRMRQLQDGINMRLARLEDATTTVKHAIVRTRAQLAQRSPAPQRPVMTPPRTALPVQPAQPQSVATPSSPVLWMVIGALLTLLAIVAYVTGRTILQRRTLSNQRSRIDAMLEQARNMATPLLGSEPEFTTAASIADRHVAAVPERPSRTEPPRQPGRDFSEQNESEIDDLTRKAPFTEAGSAFDSTSSPSDEPSYSLRMEMDDAMDNTRSMFSDVDRFITLGRIQNAISLLEFQIKRNSEDRASWIKLMAVYRHQGMDDDFDRTYAAFRDQFGDSLS